MKKSRTVAALVVAILGVGTFSIVTLANGMEEPTPTPTPAVTFDPSKVYQSETPKIARLSPDAPCQPLHFGFDGNPRKYRGDLLARYRVPKGRTWRFTNTSVMMERHHGGPYAVAGEWTGVIAGDPGRWNGIGHDGTWFTISTSSLDNGSGLGQQGQGRIEVTLAEGTHLAFVVWLRPYTSDAHGERTITDPRNYYYTLALSGMDCPV